MALHTQAGFSINFQGPTAEQDNKRFVENFAYSSLLIMPTTSEAELRDHLSFSARDQWPLKHGEKRGWGEEEVGTILTRPGLPDVLFTFTSPMSKKDLQTLGKHLENV